MRRIHSVLTALLVLAFLSSGAQKVVTPDLSKINDANVWTSINRGVTYLNSVHMDSKEGDGLTRLNNFTFENGKIELDIKGKNQQGQSFVGFAFHGLNDSTYDAIYFRPFNFKNPNRKTHSVQYISHPKYTWSKLRNDFPDKYENTVEPVPDPDDWFHATIVIEHPSVKVFVNNSDNHHLPLSNSALGKKVGLASGLEIFLKETSRI